MSVHSPSHQFSYSAVPTSLPPVPLAPDTAFTSPLLQPYGTFRQIPHLKMFPLSLMSSHYKQRMYSISVLIVPNHLFNFLIHFHWHYPLLSFKHSPSYAQPLFPSTAQHSNPASVLFPQSCVVSTYQIRLLNILWKHFTRDLGTINV